MLGKKMETALNRQINNEFYSAYIYMSMSAYATFIGLKGAANWFTVQSQEEMVHFNRFYKFMLDRNCKVELLAVQKPPSEFKSLSDMFEQTLKHEKFITKCINDLVDLSRKEKDHATEAMLQWFVIEQVEDEANPTEILSQLKLVGKDGNGLLLVDKDLATRVFVPPVVGAAAGAAAGAG